MDWQTVVNLTERMQTHAQAQQWEDVLQLSVERQHVLEQFFENISLRSAAEQQQVVQDVQTLLVQDQQLMNTASEIKNIVGMELSRIANGRKAVNSYQEINR
jgi:hypothetical protein